MSQEYADKQVNKVREPPCIMSVQYTWGRLVHWGISLSTLGDIIEYTGGCSLHWGDTMSAAGDIMMSMGVSWVQRWVFSTLGDIMMSVGDIMSTSGDVQYTGVSIQIKLFPQWPSPHLSWYPPGVLMIFPPVYWTPPVYSWYSPSVLMISPQCTHDIPPVYSWYPPVYWTSPVVLHTPGVLHRHYAGCERKTFDVIKTIMSCVEGVRLECRRPLLPSASGLAKEFAWG